MNSERTLGHLGDLHNKIMNVLGDPLAESLVGKFDNATTAEVKNEAPSPAVNDTLNGLSLPEKLRQRAQTCGYLSPVDGILRNNHSLRGLGRNVVAGHKNDHKRGQRRLKMQQIENGRIDQMPIAAVYRKRYPLHLAQSSSG